MSVRDILAELQIRPSRGRGQNFLVHRRTADKIASFGAPDGAPDTSTAVEIGPGLGALTRSLLDRFHFVAAVEIDRNLCEYLRSHFSSVSHQHLALMEADGLLLDWETLEKTPPPRILFGNVPYSISGPLMEKIFQNHHLFTEAILCLQTEVAERILSPGGRTMGSITLLAYRFCAIREKLLRLSPAEFYPRPKVSSVVIRLVFRPAVRWSEADRRIPRILFGHRRKVLSSVLSKDVCPGLGGLASKRIDQLDVETAAQLAERVRRHENHA